MDINVIYNEKGRDRLYKTWHTPENNMMIYVKEGHGSIVLSDRVYELKEGVLCFIASRCHHYTMPDEPERYLRSKVFFSDSAIDKIGEFTGSDILNGSSVIYAVIPEGLRDDIDKLFYELENSNSTITKSSCLLRLVDFLQKFAKQLREQPKGFIATTVSYINTHIHEDINIDILSKNVHMSKYHFCRRFKDTTGHTVMDYILRTRLTRAAELITDTDLSIGEISERCGFCSISYFSRVFKERTGSSPLKYRKKTSE